MRRSDGARADDDIIDARIQVGLDRVFMTYATADLQDNVGVGLRDRVDDVGISGFAGNGTIQIDDVQAPCALINPPCGNIERIVAINSLVLHAPLPEADAFAVLDIDCGY